MVADRSHVLWFAVISLLLTTASCTKETKPVMPVRTQAFPSQAGVCSLPASGNCTANSTCSAGGSCNVSLAVNANQGVDLTLNGQALADPRQIVCVPLGGSVTWSVSATPGQHNSFLLDFGNGAPFTNNSYLTYVTGSDTQSATEATANANGCYKYNVKVCPVPAAAGTSKLLCGESDPKVIVGDGGG